jgi:nucleoside ABC transporter ATP-binding protein
MFEKFKKNRSLSKDNDNIVSENNSDYVIEMRHITKEFPGIIANDDITLQLKRGEIHALLGENGAGKSTLMSVLFGLYQPEKGEILKNGQVVKINNPNDATALGIGMVHQHFKLVECFSVLDNIILGAENTKLGFIQKKKAKKKVLELSNRYGLNVDINAIIEDITVGMQQRVEILKMLYRDNEILIFDEPTAVLTPQEIDELMKIMKNLAAEGKSILFITHKLNEIMAVADRCSVLRKGKYIGTVEIKDTTKEELSEMMVGRQVKFEVDKDEAVPGDVVLNVENLCVESKIHKKLAVKDVSFQVHAGEIVCIAGIDGNGQTELVYGLTGLEKLAPNVEEDVEEHIEKPVWQKLKEVEKQERAKLFFTQCGEQLKFFFVELGKKIWKKLKKFGETVAAKAVALWNKLVLLFNKNKAQDLDPNADVRGRITLCGQDITKAPIRKRSKTGMSHIPEDRHKYGLVLDYTLEQNMVLQRYWQEEFQKGGFIKFKAVEDYSEKLIEKYDVRSGQGGKTLVRSMSGGNQQKAIVARELDREHKLLIAVQPTRGLDVGAIEYIHSQIVKDRDAGAGVLLVSLELDEVMNLSDRILVMYEGEIVGELDPKKTTVQELGLYMAGAKRDNVKVTEENEK